MMKVCRVFERGGGEEGVWEEEVVRQRRWSGPSASTTSRLDRLDTGRDGWAFKECDVACNRDQFVQMSTKRNIYRGCDSLQSADFSDA